MSAPAEKPSIVIAKRIVWALLPIAAVVLEQRFLTEHRKGGLMPGDDREIWSFFSLGLGPLIFAAVAVEIAAAVVPPWRALRVGGDDGRAKLWPATLVLAGLLAMFQTYFLTQSIEAAQVLEETSSRPPVVAVCVLIGFVVLVGLAESASRRGVGNAYTSIFITTAVTADLPRVLRMGGGEKPTPAVIAIVALAYAATAVVTVGALRGWLVPKATPVSRSTAVSLPRFPAAVGARAAHSTDAPSGSTSLAGYYAPPAEEPDVLLPEGSDVDIPTVSVPTPAAGMVPDWISGAVVSTLIFVGLAVFRSDDVGREKMLRWFGILGVVVATLLAPFVAWASNRPPHVALVTARAVGSKKAARPACRIAIDQLRFAELQSIAFVLFLRAMFVPLGALRVASYAFALPWVAFATAAVMDVGAELAFFRKHPDAKTVWPEPRPYAAVAIERALAREGIPSLLRNRHQRTMLQIFGPWVPIDVCVAAEHVERARRIAKRVLARRANDAEALAALARVRGTAPSAKALAKAAAPALVLAAVLAVAALRP